jgi:hypothetical protein
MSPSNQFVFPIYLGKDERKSNSRFQRSMRKNIFRLILVSLFTPLLAGAGYAIYRNPWVITSLNWQVIFLTAVALLVATIITGLAVYRVYRLKELMAAPAPINVRSRPIKPLVAQKRIRQEVEYKSVVVDAEMWTKDRNQSTENGRFQIGYLPEEFSADDVLVFSFEYSE